jgi:thiosulfate/3-mercaptopyruvate sulfurtransferase
VSSLSLGVGLLTKIRPTMPSFPPDFLVSTGWLGERLYRPELVILDASWYLPATGRDAQVEYRAGHIPGARYFDLDLASDTASSLPHTLPDEAGFAAYVGSLGVGNDSAIVAYDGSGSNLSAARIWWMFRAFGHRGVALLDGGVGKWRSEGRPLTGGDEKPSPREYRASFDGSQVCTLAQVEAVLAARTAQVVDVRSAPRFQGTAPEPRPGLPSGHMPGAINLPYTELVHPDGTLLPVGELRTRLEAAGLRLDRPIVATCGSGTSACTLLHALSRLGVDSGALYDGSWSEWAGRGMPVAEGA